MVDESAEAVVPRNIKGGSAVVANKMGDSRNQREPPMNSDLLDQYASNGPVTSTRTGTPSSAGPTWALDAAFSRAR